MKLKVFLILALAAFLSACATRNKHDSLDKPINDPRVYGKVMTVTEVKNINFLTRSYNFYRLEYGIGTYGEGDLRNVKLYLLSDAKGRSFYAAAFGTQEFKPGECVSYWMSPNVDNPYYPRLTRTTAGCKLYGTDGIWLDDTPPLKYDVYDRIRLQRVLDSWLDGSVEELQKQWGKPTRTFRDEQGRTAYGYNSVYVYDRYLGGSYMGEIKKNCEKIFHVSNGIIQSWSWKGNDCVAY